MEKNLIAPLVKKQKIININIGARTNQGDFKMREVTAVLIITFLVGAFAGSIISCSIYDATMIKAYCETHTKLTTDYLKCNQQALYKLMKEEY